MGWINGGTSVGDWGGLEGDLIDAPRARGGQPGKGGETTYIRWSHFL